MQILHLPYVSQKHDTMKNYISYIIAILISVITFPACQESEPIQKEIPKIVLHKKAAEVIEAEKAFGFELFR